MGASRTYEDGWEIYSLADPTTQQVKYIGVSRDATERLGFHLRFCSKRDTPVRIWVDELLEQGLIPTMQILQKGKGHSYYKLEKSWIVKFKAGGAVLLNIFGNTGRGPSKPFSEEHKAKLLACSKGHTMSEAQKVKMAEGRRRGLLERKGRRSLFA